MTFPHPPIPVPQKTALDAGTDQALAWTREARKTMTSPEGAFYTDMADGMAAALGEQFPGIPAGRVAMAVTQSLKAIAATLAETPIGSSPDVLLCIAALAAEQLDREAPHA